jgi:drug/metabolite transporter (DMT)-like permease
MLGELAGLLTALSWASTGLLVRAQGTTMSAVTINALRSTIGGAFFLAVWPFLGDGRPLSPTTVGLLVASLVAGMALGDTLYFAAIPRIGVARALPISMGYPVLTALLAVTVLRDTIGIRSAIGMAATLVGVYLVARPERRAAGESRPPGRTYWTGIALALVAAGCWSVSTVLLSPALEQVDVWTVGAVRGPLAALVLWTAAARMGGIPELAQLRSVSLVSIAGTGVLSVLSTVLFLVSIASAGAATAAVLTATSPVFGVALAMLFFRERATWQVALGTLFSVAGVIIMTLDNAG